MHSALWIIPVGILVLSFAKTWSPRETINLTVWFIVAYMIGLAVVFAAEELGYGFLSTSPTGFGGVAAMLVGFGAMLVRYRRWQEEKRLKAAAKAAEQQRRAVAAAAAGQPIRGERSLVTDAFRFAGQMQRARKNARRQS